MGRRVPLTREQWRSPLPTGGYIRRLWVPLDIWIRVASFLRDPATQQAFARTCTTGAAALSVAREPSVTHLRNCFRLCSFAIPDTVVDKVLMVHVVPPRGDGLVLFVDESEGGDGVELAWLARGRMRRVRLGLDTVPASAVSNIRFSPDGQSVALLVTLAHGSTLTPAGDPLRRLRGWAPVRREGRQVFNIEYDPCEDCTVQIVELKKDKIGFPADLVLHTFSHVFVPEYGFDLVWRVGVDGSDTQEVAFVAMLHSESGAATYLVRWKTFRNPAAANFIFMACVDGASAELLQDKKNAMLTQPSTVCTSRIELADDAKHVFFDTLSKFGVLRFDQVENPNEATVTRADLPNNPVMNWRNLCRGTEYLSQAELGTGGTEKRSAAASAAWKATLPDPMETRSLISSIISDLTRVSRMSPDGTLLCSIVFAQREACNETLRTMPTRHVEMRSSLTGHLIYRHSFIRHAYFHPRFVKSKIRLEKSGDVAQHTMVFSNDSSLITIWDTLLTKTHLLVFHTLPVVLDAVSGRMIQDFGRLSCSFRYESLQASPDGRTIYGTRMDDDKITMDAVDVLSGTIMKTVILTGPVHPPRNFSAHSIYLLPNRRLHTVSREFVDVLWDTTRGSLGCGWRSRLRSDAADRYNCNSNSDV